MEKQTEDERPRVVYGSVIVALLFIITYAVSFTWLFWTMTPQVFWIIVDWTTGYKPA